MAILVQDFFNGKTLGAKNGNVDLTKNYVTFPTRGYITYNLLQPINTSDFTIEFNLYAEAANMIVNQHDGVSGWALYFEGGVIKLKINNNTPFSFNSTYGHFQNNHYSFNRHSGTLTIYKNGILIETINNFNFNLENGFPLAVGNTRDGVTEICPTSSATRLDNLIIANEAIRVGDFTPPSFSPQDIITISKQTISNDEFNFKAFTVIATTITWYKNNTEIVGVTGDILSSNNFNSGDIIQAKINYNSEDFYSEEILANSGFIFKESFNNRLENSNWIILDNPINSANSITDFSFEYNTYKINQTGQLPKFTFPIPTPLFYEDFAVEMFARFNIAPTSNAQLFYQGINNFYGERNYCELKIKPSGQIEFYQTSGFYAQVNYTRVVTSPVLPNIFDGSFHHISMNKYKKIVSIYFDGILVCSTSDFDLSLSNGNDCVAFYSSNISEIDNFIFTKGSILRGGNFTPPSLIKAKNLLVVTKNKLVTPVGTEIIFNLSINPILDNPIIEWYVNNARVIGETNTNFITSTLSHGDKVEARVFYNGDIFFSNIEHVVHQSFVLDFNTNFGAFTSKVGTPILTNGVIKLDNTGLFYDLDNTYNVGLGDFTIEFTIKGTESTQIAIYGTESFLVKKGVVNSDDSSILAYRRNQTTKNVNAIYLDSSYSVSADLTLPEELNQENHVSFNKRGEFNYIFVNGVLRKITKIPNTVEFDFSQVRLGYTGAKWNNGEPIWCHVYLDNFVITPNATLRSTIDFIPPQYGKFDFISGENLEQVRQSGIEVNVVERVKKVSTNYTAKITDDNIIVSSISSPVTISLPEAKLQLGKVITIWKLENNNIPVICAGNVIYSNKGKIKCLSLGNQWLVTVEGFSQYENPVGTIIYSFSLTPPLGYLKANGALLLQEDFTDLYNVIGTQFNKAGDNSILYFRLPDLRGEFIRSLDEGRGIDSGRQIGTFQDASFKLHTHSVYLGNNSTPHTHNFIENAVTNWNNTGGIEYNNSGGEIANVVPRDFATADITRTTTTESALHTHPISVGLPSEGASSETKPRNIALLACIKY